MNKIVGILQVLFNFYKKSCNIYRNINKYQPFGCLRTLRSYSRTESWGILAKLMIYDQGEQPCLSEMMPSQEPHLSLFVKGQLGIIQ